MDYQSVGAIIGTSVIATLSGFCWYIGVFDRVEFQENTELGPFKFFYKNYTGDYSQSGVNFEAIRKFLSERGLNRLHKAGIYFDDPKTAKAPTRYAAGFLIATRDKHEKETEHQIVADSMNEILKEFKVMDIEKTKTISSKFPVKAGFLSFALSAMKTYPAFLKKGYVMKCAPMEIYTCETIETHFPLENFERFAPVITEMKS